MLTGNARLAVIAIALVLLGFTVYHKIFEISVVVIFGIAFLIWSYYKHGTVALASRAFHHKDYQKAELLLKEIKNPDRLSKNRRGFYEFIYGNIELQRNNLQQAEQHFQIASKFKLRNENDKAIIFVQLANLNLRKQNFEKSKAYVEKAKTLKISARVKDIIKKIEQQIPQTW